MTFRCEFGRVDLDEKSVRAHCDSPEHRKIDVFPKRFQLFRWWR